MATYVGAGQSYTISAGATSTGDEVQGGIIVDFGTAVGTFDEQGGTLSIEPSGVANGFNIVANGGAPATATAFAGGVASAGTVGIGGDLDVNGTAIGVTVAGGVMNVSAGGGATGTTITGNGFVKVLGGGGISNTTVSGGQLVVTGAGAYSVGATLSSGGRIGVSAGATISGTALAAGSIETINGGTATGTSLAVSAFIDIATLPTVAGGTADLNTATDVLTVTEGGQIYTQTLSGSYNGLYAHQQSDGAGGTDVFVNSTACYCSGTLILTTRGEVPIESLVIGDTVVTFSGAERPITWIGRRSYVRRFLASNPGAQPIRFAAGSLGDGLPRRDLLVSPEHAMFLDNQLVPARCLVNGSTIHPERGLERIDYFHVELDTHDLLLAEGAPSESFLDDDSRGIFHNAGEFAVLYPNAPRPAGYCARRVEQGPELEAIRRRLAHLAAVIAAAS